MSKRKYNEQLDTSLPLYTITCLDNKYSPYDVIDIVALRFRSDIGAINYAKEYAEKLNWHVWEIYCGRRKVKYVNKYTGIGEDKDDT